MGSHIQRTFTAFVVTVALSGCTDDVVLEPVSARLDAKWAKALREIATPSGIRIEGLRKHQETLEAYLGWASIHGQHTNSWGESKEDRRISFLLNVYNAAVLHSLLRHDFPDSPDLIEVGPFQWSGAGFYWGTRYLVDKEWVSLNHLAFHDTVNRYAEPLLWVALSDGTKDAPQLRWWTSKKGSLQPQLKRATRRFINSDRGMSKSEDGWLINPQLLSHKDDFLDWTNSETLCEWMATYATGERKAWLDSRELDCQLSPRPTNRSTDITNTRSEK